MQRMHGQAWIASAETTTQLAAVASTLPPLDDFGLVIYC